MGRRGQAQSHAAAQARRARARQADSIGDLSAKLSGRRSSRSTETCCSAQGFVSRPAACSRCRAAAAKPGLFGAARREKKLRAASRARHGSASEKDSHGIAGQAAMHVFKTQAGADDGEEAAKRIGERNSTSGFARVGGTPIVRRARSYSAAGGKRAWNFSWLIGRPARQRLVRFAAGAEPGSRGRLPLRAKKS